jgi:peptidoglycan/xylan/chitin deacetylase (PgdA/CDA1 family)
VAPTDLPPTATLAPEPTTAEATAIPTATTAPVKTTTAAAKTTTAAVKTATPTKAAQPTFTPVPPVSTQPYNGSLSEVVRGPTGKKQVAITLDAGAGAEPFPKMLSALKNANVKITFFLTGTWAQQNPLYVQQIVAGGHEIANHTWDHPDLTTVSNEKIKDEIEKTDTLLSRFTGKSTKPLFRFPYGSRNSRTTQYVNSLGYRSIFWTIDSLDSVGDPKSAQFLIDRITKQTNAQLDGEIILMHIGNATTADALPSIIQNLQDRGFQVVTVSTLLK